MVGKAVNVIEQLGHRLLITIFSFIDPHFYLFRPFYYIVVLVVVPVPCKRLSTLVLIWISEHNYPPRLRIKLILQRVA